MNYAFNYAKTTPIEVESAYPYTAHTSAKCNYIKGKGVVGVVSYEDIAQDSLKDAIAMGPVSVAIEADQVIFG